MTIIRVLKCNDCGKSYQYLESEGFSLWSRREITWDEGSNNAFCSKCVDKNPFYGPERKEGYDIRYVFCKKHGRQSTAKKYGIDDRCCMCVGEMYAERIEKLRKSGVQPMNRPVCSVFYFDYQYGNKENEKK